MSENYEKLSSRISFRSFFALTTTKFVFRLMENEAFIHDAVSFFFSRIFGPRASMPGFAGLQSFIGREGLHRFIRAGISWEFESSQVSRDVHGIPGKVF